MHFLKNFIQFKNNKIKIFSLNISISHFKANFTLLFVSLAILKNKTGYFKAIIVDLLCNLYLFRYVACGGSSENGESRFIAFFHIFVNFSFESVKILKAVQVLLKLVGGRGEGCSKCLVCLAGRARGFGNLMQTFLFSYCNQILVLKNRTYGLMYIEIVNFLITIRIVHSCPATYRDVSETLEAFLDYWGRGT